MREIIEPEIIFCTEHTLMLYPRQALSRGFLDSKKLNLNFDNKDKSEIFSDKSSIDELLDIEDGHF